MRKSVMWGLTFGVLVALSIPWFLWGSSRLVAGLPVWLWWHVGWMALAALVFHRFARRDWGLWIDEGTDGNASSDGPGRPDP